MWQDTYVLADFMVVETDEEDRDPPIVLGRPFLSTTRAIINITTGEVQLHFRDEKVTVFFMDYIETLQLRKTRAKRNRRINRRHRRQLRKAQEAAKEAEEFYYRYTRDDQEEEEPEIPEWSHEQEFEAQRQEWGIQEDQYVPQEEDQFESPQTPEAEEIKEVIPESQSSTSDTTSEE